MLVKVDLIVPKKKGACQFAIDRYNSALHWVVSSVGRAVDF